MRRPPNAASCARWRCGGSAARAHRASCTRAASRRDAGHVGDVARRHVVEAADPARARARRPTRRRRAAARTSIAYCRNRTTNPASCARDPDADFAGVEHTHRAAVEAHAQRAVGREPFGDRVLRRHRGDAAPPRGRRARRGRRSARGRARGRRGRTSSNAGNRRDSTAAAMRVARARFAERGQVAPGLVDVARRTPPASAR